VLGLGLTGCSLARYLAANGANVRVADTRSKPPFAAKLAAVLPHIPVVSGPIDDTTFLGADLIAISPGVAKDQPAIAAAVARGAELVGDIELFARALPPAQKVLAITGSNGKTTVTALTGALCRAAGLATIVAGNIGDAVLDSLPRDGVWPDVFVLELSSFQLETTSSLAPTAATVLNVTDNHLDRYADIEAYARAKARIFAGGGVQVLNRDDPRSIAMRLAARLVQTFGAGVPESEEAWGLVERGTKRAGSSDLWLARGGALLVAVADLHLVGRHNALNALTALALASAVAKIDRVVLAAATSFEGLPHRMQRIAEARGVLYVNDSKGTTVAATRVALEGLDRPVVLIAGGDGKGQDFTPLRAAVDAHCRAVFVIGRDAPLIERALVGSTAIVERLGTLDAAAARAFGLARSGDAVLLSPACASLDQFADYVERGMRFVDLVRAHIGENAHA
jgi:UDP-N-acetylmuramoylalanine--D-glutamate ligase